MFNSKVLAEWAFEEIQKFSESHREETFYGFSIDAYYLCLSSEESYQRQLQKAIDRWDYMYRKLTLENMDENELDDMNDDIEFNIRESDSGGKPGFPITTEQWLSEANDFRACMRNKGNDYIVDPDRINSIRFSTGSWEYQGFASMEELKGWDKSAYNSHYHASDFMQKFTSYSRAMNSVIKHLNKMRAFDCLNRTDDFFANKVEHEY